MVIFSILTLSFLWLFQVIFLKTYYEYVKTKEIVNIGNIILKYYKTENFKEILDKLSFNEEVCIDVVYSNYLTYSSNSLNRGCIGVDSSDLTNYKISFIQGGKDKKIYKLNNIKFDNKVIMYGIKLDDDHYVFINASLDAIRATTNILGSLLIYVTSIVLILSFIIAYYISKHITKPIIKLNDNVKKMSQGNYDVEFSSDSKIKEIDNLAITLNETKEVLSKTDTIRRELMANVSHDLKTPLTMIKAYAEVIRDLTYSNQEKTMDNLNVIIEETDRLNGLVNDILMLTKLEDNQEVLDIDKFDLNELIEMITLRFNYLKDTKKYEIIYKGTKKAIVKADKKKIEQVIYNLISNAINYIGRDKKIYVNLKRQKDTYLVEVIDHGKGIDDKEIKYVWDKYYKSDKTHNRDNNGTGLGLSIVKNIFIMHDIKYGIKSKKNEGTTFYFEIKKDN